MALHRSPQAGLPKFRPGLHVDRLEVAVEVADEGHAARRGKHAREEGGALLDRPLLFHGAHVIRREFSDHAFLARHLEEMPAARAAARTFLELNLSPQHLHAALAERNDQLRTAWVVAHGLPVVATFGA